MQIIFFMVGISLLIAIFFFGAFLWSMKSGQNDDLYTPSIRILLEDELVGKEAKSKIHP